MKNITNNIKEVRMLKHRSLHDCAKFLGISKEAYLKFEEGSYFLDLPDIELLSNLFEVPSESIFDQNIHTFGDYSLVKDQNKTNYKNLRNKMIRTKLLLAMEESEISVEMLNELTEIPLSILDQYLNSENAIPLNHLELICKHLQIPVESLLFSHNETNAIEKITRNQEEWQPAFVETEPPVKDKDTYPYNNIFEAIKYLSEKDQAEIAKILIEKLKAA